MPPLGNIPPITSTGRRRKKNSTGLLDSFLQISIGSPMARRGGNPFNTEKTEGYSGDISKHVYKKTKPKPTRTIHYEPKIKCITEVIEDFNSKGDLGVILQFTGFKFLKNIFTQNRKDYDSNSCVYSTPVNYKDKGAYLILSTIKDIFKYEVVPQRKGNQLFSDETYISELMEIYNPLSMKVVQTNGLSIISYKKNE